MTARSLCLGAVMAFLVLPVTASPIDRQLRDVERIRGLSFLNDVKVVTIERQELTSRLEQQIAKTLPYSLDEYGLILRSLHLIDEHQKDIGGELFRLLEQQVLAFYDPFTRTYFAIRELPQAARELGSGAAIEDSVVVHELTHALQDQRFAIGRRDLELRNDWDASMAYHAVIEGEATLVMMARLLEPSGQSLDDIVQNELLLSVLGSANSTATIPSSVPRYLVESLKFPYFDGLGFVIAAYRRGGWKEIDRLHADPPASTREILNPQEYFERSAPREAFVTAPPTGFGRILTIERLGAFHWSFLLGKDQARGWVNDRAIVIQDAACQPTVMIETKWDTPARAREFAEAYGAFLTDRGTQNRLTARGNVVKVAYGSDASAIARWTESF